MPTLRSSRWANMFDSLFFGATIRGNDERDRLADGLGVCVAEEPFRTAIPGANRSGQILTDDRIVQRVDYGRQVQQRFIRLLGVPRATAGGAKLRDDVAKLRKVSRDW